MIIFLALIALVSLRVALGVVTGSLKNLALEANRITQGNFDHPLQAQGVDEVGQLRRAFEQRRLSLQARLEGGDQLLRGSQGVPSSRAMPDSVKPVVGSSQSILPHSP